MDYAPYPTYRASGIEWLGNIPDHWQVRRLKFAADIQNGRDYKDVESSEGYPVLGSGGVFRFASDYLYDGESVLFGRKGTIDKPLYIKEKFWTVDTMFYSVILDGTHGRFLYFFATTVQFNLLATQTALPSITQSDLGNYRLAFPPYQEQETIARFLDHKTQQIDQLIAKKQTLIGKFHEQRIALITHAVTKGLKPDVKMKDSGVEWLGKVPEHWDIRRLKFTMTIQNGRDYKDVEASEGYPVIGSGGVFRFASDYLYDGESVLFGRKGTIDKPLYIKGKFWTVDTMFYSVILEGTNVRFIYFFAVTMQFDFLATQTALPSITQSDLGKYWIAFPPFDEQGQIVEYLEEKTARIDRMVALNQQAIDKLKEYRTALITAAVTGKIDVREAV